MSDAARLRRWSSRLGTLHDPGRLQLRVAGRAVIVVPAVFALFTLLDVDPTAALFGSFSSFALLVFADFGGSAWARTVAYGLTTAIGAGLVALGTAAHAWPATAGLGMLVVGFVVLLESGRGGFFAAGTTTVILAYVLAATVPGGWADVGPRLLGWTAGGVAALLAAYVLWPRHEHDVTRRLAADAADALAAAAVDPTRVGAAATALRADVGVTPYRLVDPGSRARALLLSVESMTRAATLLTDRSSPSTPLADATRAAFALAAQALRGAPLDADTAAGTLRDLIATREGARTGSFDRAEAQLHAGATSTEVLHQLDADTAARLAAVAAVATAAFAFLATGIRVPDDIVAELPGAFAPKPARSGPIAARRLRRELDPASIRFRNAVRGAIGLAAAVVIALLTDVQHGFWVALGTLSVLRSSAVGTSRTYVDALIGTAGGFAVASAVLVLAGDRTVALWILLPITVFAAAYAPNAISFVVGQGAFTVFVVVLFNLITPAGWSTGLVRILDIAIGGGVSLGVGLCFWPRGARGAVGQALAAMHRDGAAYFAQAAACVLHGAPSTVDDARVAAIRSETRGAAAIESFLVERRGDAALADVVAIASAASTARASGDQLQLTHDLGFAAGDGPAAAKLTPAVDLVVDESRRIAEALATGAPAPAATDLAPGPAPDPDQAVLDAIDAWRRDGTGERRRTLVALIVTRELTTHLEAILAPPPRRGGPHRPRRPPPLVALNATRRRPGRASATLVIGWR